ncbi:MAG: sporulation initiation factor Spo0A C-terminal domain-containing protein [Clostridia bacterium]|nr:sporulation initiation factor Spo0A C-terminal domain-containing protein [Clostridia bacterium]
MRAHEKNDREKVDFLSEAQRKRACFKLLGIFNALGLSSNLSGTNYLREAVLISVGERENGSPVMKDVYLRVALKFGTTQDKVERAIRNAIKVGMSRCRKENIDYVFGRTIFTERIKPTSSELIALLTDKILYEN